MADLANPVRLRFAAIRVPPEPEESDLRAVVLEDEARTAQAYFWTRRRAAVAVVEASRRRPAGRAAPPIWRLSSRLADWMAAPLTRAAVVDWEGARQPRVRLEFTRYGRTAGLTASGTAAVWFALRDGLPIQIAADRFAQVAHRYRLDDQARARGVRDERVLAAVARVRRDRFIPPALADWAFVDHAFPIGEGQTISQPSLVAKMTELLALEPGDRVLEIGGGSGYQAAILAELAGWVGTVEIVPELADLLRSRLSGYGRDRVEVREADGAHGWPERAPFDAILITCAVPAIPPAFVAQLKPGGRIVAPVRGAHGHENLVAARKRPDGSLATSDAGEVWFVPMTGSHGLSSLALRVVP